VPEPEEGEEQTSYTATIRGPSWAVPLKPSELASVLTMLRQLRMMVADLGAQVRRAAGLMAGVGARALAAACGAAMRWRAGLRPRVSQRARAALPSDWHAARALRARCLTSLLCPRPHTPRAQGQWLPAAGDRPASRVKRQSSHIELLAEHASAEPGFSIAFTFRSNRCARSTALAAGQRAVAAAGGARVVMMRAAAAGARGAVLLTAACRMRPRQLPPPPLPHHHHHTYTHTPHTHHTTHTGAA
jgi:hypothetical protein